MKTAVSLPDEVFKAAEDTARRLGLSRSELYARAIQSFVRRHEAASITESYNKAYADDQGLDPVLAEVQFASIDSEE